MGKEFEPLLTSFWNCSVQIAVLFSIVKVNKRNN
jgi:hypothetical protein